MHHWRCSLGKCGTRIPKCPWSGRWSDWEVLGFASAENTKQTRIQLHARAFGVSHIHHQEQWETDRIHSQKQNRNMLAHNRQLKLATKIKTREVLSFEACFSSKSLSGSGSRILIRTSGSRILIWTSGSKILIRTSGSRILIWTSGSRILIWTSGSRILIWTSGSRILIWRQTRKNENQNFDLGMQVWLKVCLKTSCFKPCPKKCLIWRSLSPLPPFVCVTTVTQSQERLFYQFVFAACRWH